MNEDSLADQLKALSELRANKLLNDEEFGLAKARLLQLSDPYPPFTSRRPFNIEGEHEAAKQLLINGQATLGEEIQDRTHPGPTGVPSQARRTVRKGASSLWKRYRRTRWVAILVLTTLVAGISVAAVTANNGAVCTQSLASGSKGWSTGVAPIIVGRYFEAVSTGCDGRVYVIGGLTTPDPHDARSTRQEPSVEVYDISANAWSNVAPMLTPRVAHAASTGKDGRIYAIGGEIEPDFRAVSTVEAYNPSTNTWAPVSSLPQPLSRMGAVTGEDGRIWVIANRGTYVYTPSTDSWRAAAPMPTQREHHEVVSTPDGRIWALGGFSWDVGLHELNTVEVYDPSSNKWSTSAPMPDARAEFAAVAVPDGRIFVIGGSRRAPHDTVSIFDPKANTWTAGPTMPVGATHHVAAVTGDGRVLVISGDGDTRGDLSLSRRVLLLTP